MEGNGRKANKARNDYSPKKEGKKLQKSAN